MAANVDALSKMLPDAIRHFWKARGGATDAQQRRGRADQGNRAGVTAGKNLDGFVRMIRRLIHDNGISEVETFVDGRADLTIPGFFRPTKNWDLLVVSENRLLAAIEFKSQVGPSFGNNFNNRVEESVGSATDLLTAYREGAFGDASRPFLGYFFILEDAPASTRSIGVRSPHFPILPEFTDTSYAQRYELLCRKLVLENLYDAAALILTSKSDVNSGECRVQSDMTSPQRFAAMLAGRISGMAVE
jgi:type II restriction enzyme